MKLGVITFALLMAAMGQAGAGDAQTGAQLTQRWCAQCHVIGNAVHGQDAAPSLPPESKGQDRQWLTAWLNNPHPPMPNLNLTRQEIDDIVTYLSSLPKKPTPTPP